MFTFIFFCYQFNFKFGPKKAEKSNRYPRIKVDFSLAVRDLLLTPCTRPIEWKYHSAMEEIAYRQTLSNLKHFKTSYILSRLFVCLFCCCCPAWVRLVGSGTT